MGLNEVEYTKRQVHLWFQVLLDVCRWNALLIVFSTYLPSRCFKSKILVVKSQFRLVEIPTKFQLLVKSLVYFGKTTISKIWWLNSQSLAKSPISGLHPWTRCCHVLLRACLPLALGALATCWCRCRGWMATPRFLKTSKDGVYRVYLVQLGMDMVCAAPRVGIFQPYNCGWMVVPTTKKTVPTIVSPTVKKGQWGDKQQYEEKMGCFFTWAWDLLLK